MKDRYQIMLVVFSLLVAGFFLLTVPGTVLAQGGCCRTADTLSCLGCVEGCAATENFCEAQGGSFVESQEACVTEFGDCGSLPEATTGCCLRAQGACAENLTYGQCFGENNGQFWAANEACSVVPECQEARPVPTMNQWGLVALAGVLGIIAAFIYHRRKAAA